MGSLSPTHILLFAAVALLLLGRGKLPALMGDVGKGLRSFREGLSDRDDDSARLP
jgi:sec-independent protein translocase protein TatA